jgi:uncharacterized protein
MHLAHSHQRNVTLTPSCPPASLSNPFPHSGNILSDRHIPASYFEQSLGGLQQMWTIFLLFGSNIFMTFAWYGHLKYKEVALWKVILVSWGIAFFEYCLQVPANRIGASTFSPAQLKVIQEIITLSVFGVFTVYYFGERLHWNHAVAFCCLIGGAFFMFHKF